MLDRTIRARFLTLLTSSATPVSAGDHDLPLQMQGKPNALSCVQGYSVQVTMHDGAEAEADSLAKGAQGTVFGAKHNPAVPCPAAGNADFRSAPAHDVSKDPTPSTF
jgi:hypothetical protein